MEVVRKEYHHYQPEWEQQQPTPKKKKKPQKSYRFEKAAVALSICGLLVLSLFLLLRYAAITELRHQVHSQNNTLQQLEEQKEKLKIELERVSKSRAIEEEALTKLEMKYPTPENTQYISINQTKVALLTNELNNRMKSQGEPQEQPKTNPLMRVFHKFTALLNI